MSEVYHPVDRHGMVARADERPTVTYQAEKTAAEALVVVENVEFPSSARQDASHPQAEGQGFREPACEHSGDFETSANVWSSLRRGTRKGSGSL